MIDKLKYVSRADIPEIAKEITEFMLPSEGYVLGDRLIALGEAMKAEVKEDTEQELVFTITQTVFGDKISLSYTKTLEYEKDNQYLDIEKKLASAKLEVSGLDGTLKALQKELLKQGKVKETGSTPRITVSKK